MDTKHTVQLCSLCEVLYVGKADLLFPLFIPCFFHLFLPLPLLLTLPPFLSFLKEGTLVCPVLSLTG